MGRYKVIVRLLAACFICGAVLWECDSHPSPAQMRRDHLLPLQLRDVSDISLTLADGREVVFETSPSGWNMTRPSRGRALSAAVQRLLDALEQAPLLERIDNEEIRLRQLTPEDFGFGNPAGKVAIRGPRFQMRLVVGYCDSVTNGLFVALAENHGRNDDQDVLVTTPSLREFFLKTPADYMDRRVFQCNMSMVHTVILRRPALGDVKLVRDEENKRQWNLVQPIGARADWETVGRLFEVLSATTFVDNDPDGARLQGGVFDPGEAPSVTLFGKNDLAGQTLVLGDRVPGDADLAYARGPDGVMTVTGAVRRLVLAPAYDFRDRRLFPASEPLEVQSLSIDAEGRTLSLRRAETGWAVTAPVSDAAEAGDVAALLDALLSLRADRLEPFDAETAGERVASVTAAPGRDGRPFAFSVYGPGPGSGGRLGILPDGSEALYLVPAAAVSNVLAYCLDPRPLISRTVLAVGEEHVRAISVASAGTATQRLEKVAGEWKSATPGRQADEAAVRRFFTAAAAVRAERVASLSPTPLLPLGGGVEIAFDMDDGASLRRILTIGPRQDDGHPAAVKGSDTIFILSPETVSGLTRPLFVSEESALAEAPASPPPADKDKK